MSEPACCLNEEVFSELRLSSTETFEKKQLSQALSLVKKKYKKIYNTEPDLPQTRQTRYFFAEQDQNIRALLCLEFSKGKRFSFEQFFKCNCSEYAFLKNNRKSSVYISRWVADQQLGKTLLLSALRWCIENNMQYLYACSKPRILEYLTKTLMLPIKEISAEIRIKNIPEIHENFYISKPSPILYIGRCQNWYDILSS